MKWGWRKRASRTVRLLNALSMIQQHNIMMNVMRYGYEMCCTINFLFIINTWWKLFGIFFFVFFFIKKLNWIEYSSHQFSFVNWVSLRNLSICLCKLFGNFSFNIRNCWQSCALQTTALQLPSPIAWRYVTVCRWKRFGKRRRNKKLGTIIVEATYRNYVKRFSSTFDQTFGRRSALAQPTADDENPNFPIIILNNVLHAFVYIIFNIHLIPFKYLNI